MVPKMLQLPNASVIQQKQASLHTWYFKSLGLLNKMLNTQPFLSLLHKKNFIGGGLLNPLLSRKHTKTVIKQHKVDSFLYLTIRGHGQFTSYRNKLQLCSCGSSFARAAGSPFLLRDPLPSRRRKPPPGAAMTSRS